MQSFALNLHKTVLHGNLKTAKAQAEKNKQPYIPLL
jgi:hypothetical protein